MTKTGGKVKTGAGGQDAARYIRLVATRLEKSSPDKTGSYHLQLSRLRVVRPEEKL
jgi:hypothetical protein